MHVPTSKVCAIKTLGEYSLDYKRHDQQELRVSCDQSSTEQLHNGPTRLVKKSLDVAISSCFVSVFTYSFTGKPSPRCTLCGGVNRSAANGPSASVPDLVSISDLTQSERLTHDDEDDVHCVGHLASPRPVCVQSKVDGTTQDLSSYTVGEPVA